MPTKFKSTYSLDRDKLQLAQSLSGSGSATETIERGLDLIIQASAQDALWEFMMSESMSALDEPSVREEARR